MKSPPCLSLHIGDWSRTTAALTSAARGAAIELAAAVWDRASLPDDDAVLRRLARCDAREWESVRAEVMGVLDRAEDGGLTIGFVLEQRARLQELKSKRASAGRRGAESRWQADNKIHGKPITTGVTNEVAKACPPDPDPDPDPHRARKSRAAGAAHSTQQKTLSDVRPHLLAAVHQLIESGGVYVDAHGQPNDSALLDELKVIASRHMHVTWKTAAELGCIVDSVIGQRAKRSA